MRHILHLVYLLMHPHRDNSKSSNSDNSDPVLTHIIANVLQHDPILPLINISIANIDTTVLLDCGSSVSIISNTFFAHINDSIKVRYLSRQVKITTINYVVQFSACVEISFRIESKNIKHPFYIMNMTDDSTLV